MTEHSDLPGGRLIWELAGDEPAHWRFSDELMRRHGETTPVFAIGKSDPARDWPRLHPGPLNESTGYQPMTAELSFTMTGPSAGAWHALRLQAREASGPCPDLLIEVNGQPALLIPDAVRADRSHAPSPPSPVAGVIDRVLPLPPGVLAAGDNLIRITTVAAEEPDPAELVRQQRPDLGSWFGSTLQWIRLALHETGEPPAARAEVRPTPLFTAGPGGTDRQVVEVLILGAPRLAAGPVRLAIGDSGYLATAAPAGQFGDTRIRFEVGEFPAGSPCRLRAECAAPPAELTGTISPGRKWTVHVLPHVHLDIGYTDTQAKVTELHSRNLDKTLEILRADPGYAFSVDGSFIIENFLRSRSAAQQGELAAALREGQVSTNAMWALLLTGVASLEELYRALYLTAGLRRDHGVPVRYAGLTDVPSYSWAVPSVLAAAGIPAFLGIANHTRGGNADSDELHLASPLRWRGPDGASVLAFFADVYTQLRFVCADPPTLAGMAQGLTSLLRRYERPDYLPDHFPLVGTHADNEDLSHGYADLARRWHARYTWPRLNLSTADDYFAAVEPLAGRLPELRGDGGSYWEDGVGTQAIAVAAYRRAQAALPGVEALTALVTSRVPHLAPDLAALDEAWRQLLLGCEHTWSSAHATSRPHSRAAHDLLDWKVAAIRHGARIVTDEERRALSQLGELVGPADVPAVLVVNPVSWPRTLYCDLELETGQGVTDGSAELPAHPLDEPRDGLQTLRVRVPDVPAFGYRLLPVRSAPGKSRAFAAGDSRSAPEPGPAAGAIPADGRLVTARYAVQLEPATGRITSLVHRASGREMLSGERRLALADVLYVSGGGSARLRGMQEEVSSLTDYDPSLPPPDLQVRAADLTAAGIRRTPWSWIASAAGTAPTLDDVRVDVELFDDDDRVEVDVRFRKRPELAKESVYVAFPFSGQPRVRYERHQGWVDPASDHHRGACQEWLTVQSAVLVGPDEEAVAWSSADAPLFTAGDVVRGTWATSFAPASATVLSWVMNNYWMTNTPAQQGGDARFRYAFRPQPGGDLAAARRLGRELRAGPIAGMVLPTDRCDDEPRPLPPSGELYPVSVPGNIEAALYCPRNGGSVLVRLQELAGEPASVRLPSPLGERTAWAATCSATEDRQDDLALDASRCVRVDVGPWEVKTLVFGMAD